jgi:hypothetical protein
LKTIPLTGFSGPTYQAITPLFDAERSINLYPETAGGGTAKSPGMLVGRPGLTSWATLPNGPVRALWAGDQRLFAVGGSHFYEMNANGSVKTDYGAMAGSLASGPCQIVNNGNQTLVMDSSVNNSGAIPGAVFLANSSGPTMTKEFSGGALDYLDSFFISVFSGTTGDPNYSGALNQINVSNSLDGTTWDALNYVGRTSASDLVWNVAVLNGLLWIFGQKTISIWYNAGNPNFPFAQVQGAEINLGLLAQFSVVKFNNTILWLGADSNGYAVVYQSNGTTPVRVSNHAIEQFLYNANISGLGNLAAATAFGYQEGGHTFYVLNVPPSTSGDGFTLCYDLVTGMWHERYYSIGNTFGGQLGMALPTCVASVQFPGSNQINNYVGDYDSSHIYIQSLLATNDNGRNIWYQRVMPHMADRNRWIAYPSFELDADVGTATMVLAYSNDGGRTYPPGLSYPIQGSNDQGGAFQRFKWWQLGRSRDRVFSMASFDGANNHRWVNAYVGITEGTEP